MPGRPVAAIVLLAVLAADCGGGDGLVTITTSAGVRLRVRPGSAVLELAVETVGPRAVDRVTVEVRPAGAAASLSFDAGRGAWTGLVVAAAGLQSTTVTGYAGPVRVGSVGVTLPLVEGTSASVQAAVLDTASGWPLASGAPVVTALALSPTALLVGGTLHVAAQAQDPSGSDPAWLWTSSCSGRFAPASARTSSWTPSAGGSCAVTASATVAGASGSRSGTVMVTLPPGALAIEATFVPAPRISGVALTAGAGTCALDRSGADASCRVPIRPGEVVAVATTMDAAAGAALEWSDDCGGSFAARDLSRLPAAAFHAWTPPASAAPLACTLVPRLTLEGMSDAFPVAALVTDAAP